MSLLTKNRALEFFEAKMEFTTGPVELNGRLERHEDVNVIDVRYAEDFERSHIPGATNLPRDHWDSLEGVTRDKTNIFYCYSHVCHLAAAAARYFAKHDYPVVELEGGFAEWEQHDLPVES